MYDDMDESRSACAFMMRSWSESQHDASEGSKAANHVRRLSELVSDEHAR